MGLGAVVADRDRVRGGAWGAEIASSLSKSCQPRAAGRGGGEDWNEVSSRSKVQ
jgi:hypothetical protein